jgi:hypothetical protein
MALMFPILDFQRFILASVSKAEMTAGAGGEGASVTWPSSTLLPSSIPPHAMPPEAFEMEHQKSAPDPAARENSPIRPRVRAIGPR